MPGSRLRRATNIGPVLRAHREEAGVSRTDLARALDVQKNTLVNWELGRREPPLLILDWTRQVLGLTWDELLGALE